MFYNLYELQRLIIMAEKVNLNYATEHIERSLGMRRSLSDCQLDVAKTADALARLSGNNSEFCKTVAYLIVSETVPEPETLSALDEASERQTINLEGRPMRMLDGDINPPTIYGRRGEVNPQPRLPLGYWLDEEYNKP